MWACYLLSIELQLAPSANLWHCLISLIVFQFLNALLPSVGYKLSVPNIKYFWWYIVTWYQHTVVLYHRTFIKSAEHLATLLQTVEIKCEWFVWQDVAAHKPGAIHWYYSWWCQLHCDGVHGQGQSGWLPADTRSCYYHSQWSDQLFQVLTNC